MAQLAGRACARKGACLGVVCLLAVLAACGKTRESPHQAASMTLCSRCHGSAANAAPPMSTKGDTDTTSIRVGAHQAHVTGTTLRPPIACDECHVVPQTIDAPGHIDSDHATVTFGPLARAAGALPQWTRDTATCGATYCHGATLHGGRITAPEWTKVDGSQAACGTCHGTPPPRPHVQYTTCGKCHAGYAPGVVEPATHIDGKVDYVALACTTCHGTAGVNAAPPIGTAGETATTQLAVGAHQAHVVAGRLRGPMRCEDCHVVPTEMLHATGTVNVTWGALATTSGATPAWDPASATCASTYCHGGTFRTAGDGTLKTPVWTRVDGTQAACGTCHGDPPPYPHPPNPSCNRCHPLTVLASGALDVAGGHHVDGTLDVGPLTCTSCHGTDGVNAAPPIGTRGETDTTALAVGAHQAHVVGGAIRGPLGCEECHVVPTSMLHATGTVNLTWGALATTGGLAPAFSPASATCAATYCHGAGFAAGDGTLKTPVWTRVDGTQAACGTCHGDPPPAPHPPNPLCNRCHPATVLASGAIDIAGGKHINGTLDVGPLTCTSCHGTDGVNAAPPIGTRGETATTTLAVGAHQAHLLGGAIRGPIPCAECHVVPTSMLHANGTVNLTWGALSTSGGAAATFDAATATCSNYCHGATLRNAGDGTLKTPVWTRVDGTQAACGTCHGFPPPTNHPQSTQCHSCHQDTVDASGHINVAGGKHINGVVDLSGAGCSACHGSTANPAPPVGTHGETATTTLAVGAHQQHVTDGKIRKALACSDCHVVPTSLTTHPDGTLHMAWSALATGNGATTPVLDATAATCAATYCHGTTLAGGGTAKTPMWTKVDGTQATCGSCHGAPPAAPHPPNPVCNSCHPLTVAADGTIDVAGGYHINGTIDVAGLTCHSCHGSTTNDAPPIDTRGNSATTFVGVGAHQAHLLGGAIRGPLPCSECHTVPTTMTHATGTVTLTWGPLAGAAGATASFDSTTARCSNYCHGETLPAGPGTLKTPIWTEVDGTQAACGTCHGIPPATNHPQSTDCHACHQDTVDANGNIIVAGGKHINGVVDLSGAGCSACHGSSANPAPPVGTHGETATTTLAVGAHQQHVTDGKIRAALSCSDCHLVPTSLANHPDGTVHMAWSALATGNGATTPALDTTAATCAATYCHGATLKTGGDAKTPIWTKVDGTQAQCDSCHGNPPGNWHPPNPLCNSCHPLTVAIDGTIDVAGGKHIDGTVEVAGLTCTSCHGTQGKNPAPPVDTKGNSATTFVSVGAHQAHLLGSAIRGPLDCTECHVVPSETLHATGTVTLTWGPLATAGGAAATFDATNATCSNYCHGETLPGGAGTLKTPVWTKVDGTQAACGTCHGLPPATNHPQSTDCHACHQDTVDASGNIIVAGGKHINGVVDLSGGGCSACHGSSANPAPPVGTHGETATTTLAVGAHQAHVTDGKIRTALSCNDCHLVPTSLANHPDGTVHMAWSALATGNGATTPVLDPAAATCAATYCHGATLKTGGDAKTPIWTKVDGTQAQCDSCHGNPPGNWHPPNPLCNSCHPLTVAIDGTIDVAGGKHIDGTVEVAGLTCTSCHGTQGKNPAPPVDTKGNSATTFVGVGAHQAHLLGSAIRGPLDCAECHVVPTTTLHANGTVTLTWGPLTTANGTTATFDATNATCSNYCHGAAFRPNDGALKTPIWTKVDGSQAACGTCHGFPPPPAHPQSTQCHQCHPATVLADGTIDVAGGHHIDGKIDASGTCGACHGIPPADGAHAVHAVFPDPTVPTYGDLRILEDYSPNGGPAYQFGCGNCHPIDPAKHMDLVVEVELSPTGAPAGTLKSLNAPTAAYDKASGTCSGAYCHSSGQAVPTFAVTPGWTSGATLACDGCHANPPAYPSAGPGAAVANSHLGLSDRGREFGHFAGLAGPLHDTKHGGGVYGSSEGAAPITCQTCHYQTTDPAGTGRSGFYWLNTNGTYVLAGGDPARTTDPRWKATQCGTCHSPSGPAPVGNAQVLPLRHVNGRRDVVFDPRTALPAYTGLPAAPDQPTHPYWVTHAAMCDPWPPAAVLDGTTMSFDLSGAQWDPATKTCSSVPCHLADTPRWGGGYVTKPTGTASSCCACHGGSRCGR